MKPVLHVLTGPTAVGKTEWALRWAEQHRAEIVSCDSLLFYRGLDIGTAKPAWAERARVLHHLIDIRDVTQPMDITDYVRLARAAVDDITQRGQAVLVTGGSGFYLTANPRRVARALERCLASGRKHLDLVGEFARQPSPFADFAIKLTRLEREPDEMARRIDERVAAMVAAGLVEEVRRLRAAGLEQNRSARKAIGYREVIAMLDGQLSPVDLMAEIAKNTRALVKKQRTWFRTQVPPHRVVAVAAISGTEELFAD
jgi:tRNA dimethylallyltransferase